MMMDGTGGMHSLGMGYGSGWIIGLMILFTLIWIGILIYRRSKHRNF